MSVKSWQSSASYRGSWRCNVLNNTSSNMLACYFCVCVAAGAFNATMTTTPAAEPVEGWSDHDVCCSVDDLTHKRPDSVTRKTHRLLCCVTSCDRIVKIGQRLAKLCSPTIKSWPHNSRWVNFRFRATLYLYNQIVHKVHRKKYTALSASLPSGLKKAHNLHIG